MTSARRRLAVWSSIGLYFASLILPVSGSFFDRGGPRLGHGLFLDDFDKVISGLGHSDWESLGVVVTWFANPAMWVALVWLVLGYRPGAIGASLIAVLLGAAALPNRIEDLMWWPSYWCWWGSAVAALLAALFVLPRRPMPDADDYRPITAVLTPDPCPLTPDP